MKLTRRLFLSLFAAIPAVAKTKLPAKWLKSDDNAVWVLDHVSNSYARFHFHRGDCECLPMVRSKGFKFIGVTLQEAIDREFRPCPYCKPFPFNMTCSWCLRNLHYDYDSTLSVEIHSWCDCGWWDALPTRWES